MNKYSKEKSLRKNLQWTNLREQIFKGKISMTKSSKDKSSRTNIQWKNLHEQIVKEQISMNKSSRPVPQSRFRGRKAPWLYHSRF